MTNNNKIGNHIKKALRIRNKTQRWLADHPEVDVTPQHVNKWCTNKNKPSTENLLKISKILDFEVNEIQTGNFKNESSKRYSPEEPVEMDLVEHEKKSIEMVLDELKKDNLTKQKKEAYKASILNKIDLIINLVQEE